MKCSLIAELFLICALLVRSLCHSAKQTMLSRTVILPAGSKPSRSGRSNDGSGMLGPFCVQCNSFERRRSLVRKSDEVKHPQTIMRMAFGGFPPNRPSSSLSIAFGMRFASSGLHALRGVLQRFWHRPARNLKRRTKRLKTRALRTAESGVPAKTFFRFRRDAMKVRM